MTQDINKILDNLNADWASDMIHAKRKIAILSEENERLKAENELLKNENMKSKDSEESE